MIGLLMARVVRGLSPRRLDFLRKMETAVTVGSNEAKRAFDAMMGMRKIDVAAVEAARRG
jgi:hypothetical protein